jgi:transposase
MLRYLQSWIDQLRWQRLKPMEKLARMLLDHLEGIKALLRRGRAIET